MHSRVRTSNKYFLMWVFYRWHKRNCHSWCHTLMIHDFSNLPCVVLKSSLQTLQTQNWSLSDIPQCKEKIHLTAKKTQDSLLQRKHDMPHCKKENTTFLPVKKITTFLTAKKTQHDILSMQRKHSILSLQRKHDMTFSQCKENMAFFHCKENTTFLTARETTWITFLSTEALHKGLRSGIQRESEVGRTHTYDLGSIIIWQATFRHKRLAINFGHGCRRLWWREDTMLYPSQTPIQHPLSRIPLPIHQEFQRVQSLCGNMFDLLHTVEWTQPKEHPCNMKRASEQAWERERERDFYSANSTPIRRSFDHGISNSSHSLPTKHHKHPPSLQLALLLTSNSTTQLHKDPLENLRQGKNRLQFDDLHQYLSSITSISIISFHLFLLASLPPLVIPLAFFMPILSSWCFCHSGKCFKLRGFDCGLRHLRRLTYKNSKFVNVTSREHNWAKCLTTSNNYSSKQRGSMTCNQVRQVRLHDL